MRRLMITMIIFSLFLSGCTAPFINKPRAIKERTQTAFEDWTIPGTFVPKQLYVVGLGDSLTQGVGDEHKRGGYFGRMTVDVIPHWKGVTKVHAKNLAKRGRRSDQLLEQLEEKKIQSDIKNADVIFVTIGGNDLMKIIKRDLFKLKKAQFYEELDDYSERIDEVFGIIRALNSDAVIITAGLYNPMSILTDEVTEFEDIIEDWNEAIEMRAVMDGKACFIPVTDLFNSNVNMVYHTDFFHPNAKGYNEMTERFIDKIEECDLLELSDGYMDM